MWKTWVEFPLILNLKDWRRVATRHDRCPKIFLFLRILRDVIMLRLSILIFKGLTVSRLQILAALLAIVWLYNEINE